MAYLTEVPIKGKWYVSEGFTAERAAGLSDEELDEHLKHNRGAHRMLLAGPYDSKEQAKADLGKFPDAQQPIVWECSGG